jgi:hypothetical protein
VAFREARGADTNAYLLARSHGGGAGWRRMSERQFELSLPRRIPPSAAQRAKMRELHLEQELLEFESSGLDVALRIQRIRELTREVGEETR